MLPLAGAMSCTNALRHPGGLLAPRGIAVPSLSQQHWLHNRSSSQAGAPSLRDTAEQSRTAGIVAGSSLSRPKQRTSVGLLGGADRQIASCTWHWTCCQASQGGWQPWQQHVSAWHPCICSSCQRCRPLMPLVRLIVMHCSPGRACCECQLQYRCLLWGGLCGSSKCDPQVLRVRTGGG